VFATVAVLTLALGIGSNSAIFTLVSAHFLAPLPWERPRDLVLLWEADRATGDVTTVSPGNYWAWKEQARSFSGLAAFNVDVATVSDGEGAAEEVTASLVTPDFFEVLGVRPGMGAAFTADAARQASGDLVVLGHAIWVRRFGADPGIVGRSVRIDGRPHTVVGVAPEGFRQPERRLVWQGAQLWRPLLLEEEHDDFDSRYLRTVARLAPGASLAEARVEMNGLYARVTQAHPEQNGAWSVTVRTVDDYLLGDARPVMWMLLGAGAAVLLIVCANVANLTLARGQERRREFAVRAALGSGGARLLRQVVVESVVLSAAGGAVGAFGVYAARGLLQAVQSNYFSGLVDAAVDWRVVSFTALVALAAGVVFALPLARTASRAGLRADLGEGGARSGAGVGVRGTRNLLVVGQVALATTLLVVATLLARSFGVLVSVPPGFDPRDRITFDLSVPRARYPDRDALERYYREVRRDVEAVPGVVAVSMTSDLPFTSENRWTTFGLEGRPFDERTAPRADFHTVLPDYFEVMGIPLREGRIFTEAWEPVEDIPIVVNERMARRVEESGDAVGRSVLLYRDGAPIALEIVGVVGDVLDDGYAADAEPVFYMPWGASPQRGMSVVARVRADASGVVDRVREAVARIDPDIPAARPRTLDALLAETVARPHAASRIGATFALLALLVAAAGIYGVLSYAVQSRTREIGIRSALGADPARLVTMILGHAGRLLAVGLILGLAGALAAGAALSGILFGVRAWDPLSVGVAVTLLGGIGALAAWLPARRAVRVDPKVALTAD
jgi:putative ABC transport system permease protein